MPFQIKEENNYWYAYLHNSLFLFILSFLLVFFTIPITQFKTFQFFGFLFAFVSFIAAILFLLKFLRFKKGKKGETSVNSTLSKLMDYELFSNIYLPKVGDIDHILIGKNGIIFIETKNYTGNLEINGDDWYINGNKINSPSLQVKRTVAKFKEILGIKKWFDCIIIPIADGTLHIKNQPSNVDIVKLGNLIEFVNKKRNYVSADLLSNIKNKIKELQSNVENKITLRGLFNSWWFNNYKKFFIFGLVYGTIYVVGTAIFSFLVTKNYGVKLPYYTITEDIIAIFYVGVFAIIFGKIILDIFKIDLKIELSNIGLMAFFGYLPIFAYSIFTSSFYPIGELAELVTRVIAMLICYFILKTIKFELPHRFLK